VLLVQLLDLYTLIVFGAVIISWVQLPPTHPIARILARLTEPLLAPIRKVMPDLGGLDLSPMALLLGVRLVRGFVLNSMIGF
jgi:YggT family protein